MHSMQQEELYYDHYKDSFEQQKNYLQERNKLTVYIILLVAIIFLMSSNRLVLIEVSSSLQQQKIGKEVLDFNIVATALYFAFMWLSMRYYQINLTIEKTYDYIKRCEANISARGSFIIDREGGDYEKNYPWLKWLVHRIYVFIFPLLILIASVTGIIVEVGLDDSNRVMNILFLTITIMLSLLYLLNRICGK